MIILYVYMTSDMLDMELELLMNDNINAGISHITYSEYEVPKIEDVPKASDVYISSISFQTKSTVAFDARYDKIVDDIINLHQHNPTKANSIKYIRYLGSVHIINPLFKKTFPTKTILKKQISIHVQSPHKTFTKLGECFSNINIKLCANGMCNISGCRSVDDMLYSMSLIDTIIPYAHIEFDQYSIIVASASIAFKISIKHLYRCLNQVKEEYKIQQVIEPTHSRLIIKFNNGTITIFPRGGINISSYSIENIRQLYDTIVKIIYKNIREVYMGDNEKFHKINKISCVPDKFPTVFTFRNG